jgi:uncharacterized protein involved in response to NO
MTVPAGARGISPFRGPLWASGFRPFFLLGALYGLITVGTWLGAYVGYWTLAPVGMTPAQLGNAVKSRPEMIAPAKPNTIS